MSCISVLVLLHHLLMAVAIAFRAGQTAAAAVDIEATGPTSAPASIQYSMCYSARTNSALAADGLILAGVGGNVGPLAMKKRQDSQPAQGDIPQTAAIGGLSMTQPPVTAQATYHKIARENYVTFGWAFTDVIATPQRLTLQAYCSQNGYTYPVGPTSGIAGDSTNYVWNPFEYEQSQNANPLAEASYTLRIFDERGYFAQPTAGRVRPYAGSVFALYRPQAYTPLSEGWTCAACSAAAQATFLHPAVLATAVAILAGAWTVYSKC